MDMDIQESKARRHNERLFFETDLEAARRSNDSDKARREAEVAGLKEALNVLESETAFIQKGSRTLRGTKRH